MTSSQLQELMERILNFDRRVRYCAIIDRAGDRIMDKLRNGITPLDSPEIWEDALRRRAIAAGVFETLFPHYGRTRCIIGIYQKVIVMISPTDKHLTIATMDTTMSSDKIQKLHELIENYPQS